MSRARFLKQVAYHHHYHSFICTYITPVLTTIEQISLQKHDRQGFKLLQLLTKSKNITLYSDKTKWNY